MTVTDYEDQHVMEKLLQLAFTPSIERLGGKALDIFSSAIRLNAIYTTIIKIAESSPIKFDRLKIIPDTFILNELYGKTLLAFKETLETVQLRLFNHDDTEDVLHRFDEFKQLKALRMEEAEFNSIEELNAVLKGCHNLKELFLNVEILDQMGETPTLATSSDVLWQRMQVEKVPSLEKLSVISPGYPLLVEYLVYKYPNVQDFRLDPMAMVEPSMDNNLTSINFERILKSLKPLKKYSIDLTMPPGDSLNRKCTAGKGDINSLTIQYPMQYIDDDEMYLHLDVTTLEKICKANFILEVPTIAASYHPIHLAQEAGIPLERLELDFVNCAAVEGDDLFSQQIDRGEEAAVFFDMLYAFPQIKEMKLTAHYLSEASDMFSAHDTIELRSLEIRGAEVTQDALQCISYECPQLKELKLLNCYLAPDDRQNTFHVRMGRTSFDHFIYTHAPVLDIVRDKEDQDAIDHFSMIGSEMETSWIQSDIYLWLGIKEAGKKIYFQICVGSDESPDAVCQEIFDLRPVENAPLIRFTCFNIKSLTIQLGPFSFLLKEELIKRCIDSSFMSYPLENGDIDTDEEE